MRDEARAERIIDSLEEIWRANKDWSFGEVIENFYGYLVEKTGSDDPFALDDNELEYFISEYAARMTGWRMGNDWAERIMSMVPTL